MLTFDKLKLVTSLHNISITDESRFKKVLRNDALSYLIYTAETLASLTIKIDFDRQEAVVEFTGKILGAHYPQLISYQNIRECFDKINLMGCCRIDAEAMMDSKVVKCDATKDVRYRDIPYLTSYIRNNVKNHQQYICRIPKNGNLIVEKNVMTRQCRKRLTIYDKGKEMSKADNLQFTNAYEIDSQTFDGICRFELNLNSVTQIENSLQILQTTLHDVLHAECNTIQDFVNQILADGVDYPITDKKSYHILLTLKDCDYDIEKVELKMRQFHPSRGVNIGKMMAPYREMLILLQNNKGRDYKGELLDLLA